MKILHIVPTYIPAYRYGGPIRSVHGLCKGLAQLGHEVHVFTTNVDGSGNSNVPLGVPVDIDGVKVCYYPSNILRRLYRSQHMKKVLKQSVNSFDLVHLHSVFLWTTFAGARISLQYQVPYFVSPRGMLVQDLIKRKSRWIKSLWIKLFDQYTLEHANGIHVTSTVEEAALKRFDFRLPATYLIPNGIDMPDINQISVTDNIEKKQNNNNILFIGRVNWEKGLDILIASMAYVPKGNLVIAGNDEEGYQKKLEKIAVKYNVSKHIQFIGSVNNADKESLFSTTPVLVLPSYSENFGIVVLEAMSHGCPVIVTPEVGIADVVKEFKTGIVCEGNPETLGHNINMLLGNSELRKEMGDRGKLVAKEQYSWLVIARQMVKAYHHGIEKHNRVC